MLLIILSVLSLLSFVAGLALYFIERSKDSRGIRIISTSLVFVAVALTIVTAGISAENHIVILGFLQSLVFAGMVFASE